MGRPGSNFASTSKNVVNPDMFDDYLPDNFNIMDDYNPTLSPDIQSLLNDPPYNAPFGNLDPGGSSYFPGETSGYGGTHQNIDLPQSSGSGNPVQVSVRPIPTSPFNCSGCQTLREIVHTNGHQFEKLEMHGRVGLFSHAVLCKYENAPSTYRDYQMFDFSAESIIGVKKFLVQYCQDRIREGYHMLRDPILLFYDALIVGLNFDNNPHQPTSPMTSDCNVLEHQTQPVQQENEAAQIPRSSLSLQRRRTRNLELKDLAKYFHLKLEDAAKELHVCPTVVKNIWRRCELGRWPHRKVKSIKRKISEKKQERRITRDVGEKARVQADIQELERQLTEIYNLQNAILGDQN